jgi:alkanesulfonate monooxygenase SsuD/methylene tetrahydromethanopterin reductase-like flavin-dependent oxidoreductase (luciferase family)
MKLSVYLHGSSPFNPKTSIEEYVNLAKRYENDGLDTLWFADHLIRTPDPNKSPLYETWTLISALAMVTKKIRFGTMVTPVTFRNIGVFAKMISTIDHVSDGRITVGLGNGWYEKEHECFALEFGTMQERMRTLEYWLQDLLALWNADEAVIINGNILKNAYLNPKPLQKPHPPILIGGGGEKVTLKYVAKYAQMSNFGGSVETLQNKIKVLEKHCDDAGRNISDITTTTNMAAIIGLDDKEVNQAVNEYRTKLKNFGHTVPSLQDFARNRLVGTPEQILEQIDIRKEIGIDMINMTINDKRSEDLVGLLINEF